MKPQLDDICVNFWEKKLLKFKDALDLKQKI